MGTEGELRYKGRLYVPKKMREKVLRELHQSQPAVHPKESNVSRLEHTYWRPSLRKDIAQFVAHYLMCQQVKGDRKKPSGDLQPLEIPNWNWEHISMDFVIGLPRFRSRKNIVWVKMIH